MKKINEDNQRNGIQTQTDVSVVWFYLPCKTNMCFFFLKDRDKQRFTTNNNAGWVWFRGKMPREYLLRPQCSCVFLCLYVCLSLFRFGRGDFWFVASLIRTLLRPPLVSGCSCDVTYTNPSDWPTKELGWLLFMLVCVLLWNIIYSWLLTLLVFWRILYLCVTLFIIWLTPFCFVPRGKRGKLCALGKRPWGLHYPQEHLLSMHTR